VLGRPYGGRRSVNRSNRTRRIPRSRGAYKRARRARDRVGVSRPRWPTAGCIVGRKGEEQASLPKTSLTPTGGASETVRHADRHES
jgi:hypothetical protein